MSADTQTGSFINMIAVIFIYMFVYKHNKTKTIYVQVNMTFIILL